ISAYITAARMHVEASLSKILIEQEWRINFDYLPIGETIELPLAPIIAVNVVSYFPEQGGPIGISAFDYAADLDSDIARFCLRRAASERRKFGGYEIEVTAGYGPAAEDVPGDITQAITLLVAHWYEHREAASSILRDAMPHGVKALLNFHRRVRL
ncbi:MAG: phage head-tail connector protein, partial [Rhizobiales bacterium]|nr:phage head-tail connector protein [Hyphomicrobiales bacterium]